MEKQLIYGKDVINYLLLFSDRKTLGIKITPDAQITVTAPLNTPMEKIEQAVRKKAYWISTQRNHFLRFDPIVIHKTLKSGYTILYLGRSLKITIQQSSKNEINYTRYHLTISSKELAGAERQLEKWLHQKAKERIVGFAQKWISEFEKTHAVPSEISFQQMPVRWGSCTIQNKLIFNPKLIHLPKQCIEYVIVHELCHLVHKKHNKEFFDLLTFHMPDWERRKKKLDKYSFR